MCWRKRRYPRAVGMEQKSMSEKQTPSLFTVYYDNDLACTNVSDVIFWHLGTRPVFDFWFLPLQDVRVAFSNVVVHALELGDVPIDDGCNQPLGKLGVIDMGRVVSIAQHT